MIYDVFLTCG